MRFRLLLSERADGRSMSIINERLTTADAEQFVQENIGAVTVFGDHLPSLGELYEADGEIARCGDIYGIHSRPFPERSRTDQRARW